MSSLTVQSSASDGKERSQGKVKWFSEKRGYGFIQIDDEEVFIHRSSLAAFGIAKLQNEDVVTVSLTVSERGRVVDTLYGVERPPIPLELMAETPEEGEVFAEVKFFNNQKGYGFITTEDEDGDIFVHFRILEQNGFSMLEQGQKLLVRLEDSDRGKQVTTIRLYIGDENPNLDMILEEG
jgi:CspA family cold shock protein